MSRVTLVLLVTVGCSTEPPGPQPELPAKDPPPSWGVPLTGGTMLVTRDGRHAVISDPDRDRIATVDLTTREVVADIALTAGDEPGRLVEDRGGRIHVVLRRGGAVLTIPDPKSGRDLVRRSACSEPRGIAHDAATDTLHVACASGELVSFAASGGDAIRRRQLDRDLRDVVVMGDGLAVTRFRTAEVLRLDAQGTVIERLVPPNVKRDPQTGLTPQPRDPVDAVPAVAWRTVAMPDGRLVISHQRQLQVKLGQSTDGYSLGCPGAAGSAPIESAITVIAPGTAPFAAESFAPGALPIDIAVAPAGSLLAVIIAASDRVVVAPASMLSRPDHDPCASFELPATHSIQDQLGAPASIAFRPTGALLIYYPEAPALVVHDAPQSSTTAVTTIQLPGKLGYDSGRALFHRITLSGMTCASCHPEGGEDGLVWDVDPIGPRRTQSLAGHIVARAPYHWNADMPDLRMLMSEVFMARMGGDSITRSQYLSLGPWLDRIPAPRWAATDPAAAARGKALFDSPALACATCHAGELLTNNRTADVGTGGAFKVPSLLGVAARAPFLHDGCAATLVDSFTTCTTVHGTVSSLTPAQLADLIVYLESI
jgi:cytochrome c553